MFVGINGGGKTTAIAKLAYRMQKHGLSCVLAAGDTFRAGAIEQLTLHSEKLGCKIIKHQEGSDPAAVAYDAIEHAKARKKDIVLIDTAGRMQTNTNLMDEMKKIRRVAKPDIVVFVGDALAGSDAVEQAKRFDAAVGIDAVILTKIDADAKGGAALSIAKTIGKPIAYVSIGQEYDEFRKFDPDWMVERIFGDKQPMATQDLSTFFKFLPANRSAYTFVSATRSSMLAYSFASCAVPGIVDQTTASIPARLNGAAHVPPPTPISRGLMPLTPSMAFESLLTISASAAVLGAASAL